MASEDVLKVQVHRHVFGTERSFSDVIDGIYEGISRPDIEALFGELARTTSYAEFSLLVHQAQGSAGLMRFLELDLDTALALDPQAGDQGGLRLVRLIAGNPVTVGEMTRHVADAGSYAPVTLLIQELPSGGTRIAYDTVTSEIALYQDAAATQVAGRLDAEVLGLLRRVSGMPSDDQLLTAGPGIRPCDRNRDPGSLPGPSGVSRVRSAEVFEVFGTGAADSRRHSRDPDVLVIA